MNVPITWVPTGGLAVTKASAETGALPTIEVPANGLAVTEVASGGIPIFINTGGVALGGDTITNLTIDNTTTPYSLKITTDKGSFTTNLTGLQRDFVETATDITFTNSDGTSTTISKSGGSIVEQDPVYLADKINLALKSEDLLLTGKVKLNNADGTSIELYSIISIDNKLNNKANATDLSNYLLNSTYESEKTSLNAIITGLDSRLTAEESLSSDVITADGETFTFVDKNGVNGTSWTISNSNLFNFIGDVATIADLPTGQTNGTVAHVVDEDKFYLFNGTDWVPLTLSVDLSDYYNKAEVDARLDTKVGNVEYSVDQTLQNAQITGLDSRVSDVEAVIPTLEKKHTFTGTAGVDGIILFENGDKTYDKDTIDSKISSSGTFDPTNYYTKTDIDTKFGEYYTKTEIDTAVTALETKFGDYYLKTEVDALLAGKVDTTTFDSSQTAQDGLISTNTSDISALNTRVTDVEGDIVTINTELASKVNTTDFEASQLAQDTVIDSKVGTTTFNLSQGLQDNRITNVEEDVTTLQTQLSAVILEQSNNGPVALSTTPTSILSFPAITNGGKYNGAMRATWTGSGSRDINLTIYINGVATSRTATETITDNKTASIFTATPLDLVEGDVVEVYASSTTGSVEAIAGALQLVLSNNTVDLSGYVTTSDYSDDKALLEARLDGMDTTIAEKVDNTTYTTGQATQDSAISANETNIATNTSDISALDTRITANESDITALQTNDTAQDSAISANASAITSLNTDLANKMNVNFDNADTTGAIPGQVPTVNSDLSGLEFKSPITGTPKVITANSSAIYSNTLSLGGEVFNSSSITTSGTNITFIEKGIYKIDIIGILFDSSTLVEGENYRIRFDRVPGSVGTTFVYKGTLSLDRTCLYGIVNVDDAFTLPFTTKLLVTTNGASSPTAYCKNVIVEKMD